MVLWRLFAEWRARLRRWQAVAADPESGQVWLAAIRVRILKFLLARYAEAGERPPVVTGSARSRRPALSFCIVAEADGPPPRSSREIARILVDIRACNRQRTRRLWFLRW